MRTHRTLILERISTAATQAQTGHITGTSLQKRLQQVSHVLEASSTLSSDSLSASSIPRATTSAPVASAQTSEPGPSSKAWIAGAVVGPVLGLALLGAGVWLLLRRRRKAAQLPQLGGASMAPIDPNQPPTGVGGYTETKPRFHPAQPTHYDRPGQSHSYAQQGYPQQGGFSPTPQYGFQSAYNATADSHIGHSHEPKYEGFGDAAELGGDVSAISPRVVPVSELSGVDADRPGERNSANDKPH
jgi:LPXTG-motif cell wall-anchored protein